MTAIAEEMRADFEDSLIDDEMEEAFCFLTGSKSSYELLDECQEEEQ
ncbi:MAG: hypothetical protein PHC62_00495 [Candidatus Izemoplasmatales bacterium]|nr:hypothetical protein [Candidatus Izemoplasmatales bacterium]